MKREEELKPCPFCGASAHVEPRQSTKYQCDNCGCMLETGEERDFGRDWNRRALLPTPVGWETDAEWDLEMRCANITESTPFDEVSKLINDLWQQYCLAAEPKGVDHQVHHSKPVASQNTQIVEDKATEGVAHEKALTEAYNAFARYEWEQGRAWRGPERDALEVFLNAYRAALTAKQTDGRDGE